MNVVARMRGISFYEQSSLTTSQSDILLINSDSAPVNLFQKKKLVASKYYANETIGCGKKYPLSFMLQFSQQSLGI